MASITFRQAKSGPKWRVLVRRIGRKPLSQTFNSEAQAVTWATCVEADIDLEQAKAKSEFLFGGKPAAEALQNAARARAEAMLLTERDAALLFARKTKSATLRMAKIGTLSEAEIVSASVPLSEHSGVYFLIAEGRVVYVGASSQVRTRVMSHVKAGRGFDSYACIPCDTKTAFMLEKVYIKALAPEQNQVHHPGGINRLTPEQWERVI